MKGFRKFLRRSGQGNQDEFRCSLYENAEYQEEPVKGRIPYKITRPASVYRPVPDGELSQTSLASGNASTTSVNERETRPIVSRQNGKRPQSLYARPPSTGNLNELRAKRFSHVPDSSEVLERAKQSSVDTTVHTKVAPAVTHETIHNEVHEVREERITREIHTHDVFHRILPIVDVEVLPARHFVRQEGKLVEIDPPATEQKWVVAETVTGNELPGPRKFTAAEFRGTDGDKKEYVTDGVRRTEQTWVHPPTVATVGRDTGQTEPIYL